MDIQLNDIFTSLVRRVIKKERIYSTLGVVKSIGSTTYTIKPNDGGSEIEVNRISDETIELIPSVGSLAMVVWNDNKNAYTLMVSGVSDVIVNGGLNGGLIKVTELTAKLNALVTTVNALITAYNAHVHGVQVDPPPVPPVPSSPPAAPATPAVIFIETQYTNLKVKH